MKFAAAVVFLGISAISAVPLFAAVTVASPHCISTADNETACGPFSLVAGAAPITSNYLTLSMEADGNLVLYRAPGRQLLWQSNTSGACSDNCLAVLQPDGNLVLYKNGSTPTGIRPRTGIRAPNWSLRLRPPT